MTATHYDALHNFYVQVRGCKRFLLFPPETQMYLHPSLHPHYAHAQVDVMDPDPVRFPSFAGVAAYEVVLLPGDVLYLPPYWYENAVRGCERASLTDSGVRARYHYVETVVESVSVNVWSHAIEHVLLHHAYTLPIPVDENAGEERTWTALACILRRLVAELMPGLEDSVGGFAEDLLENRFQPLLSAKLLRWPQKASRRMRDRCEGQAAACDAELSDPGTLAKIDAIRDVFLQMPNDAVRATLLMNYAENAINAVVGTDYVITFLKFCLR